MENLIVQTAFLGDLLLSIPLIREFKAVEPDRPLVLLCRKGFGALISELKLADRIIEVDKSKGASFRQVKRSLADASWHTVLCPHQSVRSALLVHRLQAQRKLGFRSWWNFFAFDQRVQRPMPLPDAFRQLSLLTLIDSNWQERFENLKAYKNEAGQCTIDFRQQLSLPQWARMQVQPWEGGSSKAIALAPGSVWPTKRWSLEGYIKVARRLIGEGYKVKLLGSPEEAELCLSIKEAVPEVESYAGDLSLVDSLKVLQSSRVLVSNDSGAMHMASLVGLPTVAVFGPTTLSLGYRPSQDSAIVVQTELPCRPCGKHGAKKCPIGTHACMKTIDSQDVFAQVIQLIGETDPIYKDDFR